MWSVLEERTAPTVVLGVGNLLLTDEGAGVHAIRKLTPHVEHRDDVFAIDGGTLSFTLAPAIEAASRLIIIDAAQLHAPPGTVRVFYGEDMDRFLGVGKRSVHEVSLIDLLDITRVTTGIPAQRALIGVQPREFDWGDVLTPDVERGVDEAVRLTLALIEQWPQPEIEPELASAS